MEIEAGHSGHVTADGSMSPDEAACVATAPRRRPPPPRLHHLDNPPDPPAQSEENKRQKRGLKFTESDCESNETL